MMSNNSLIKFYPKIKQITQSIIKEKYDNEIKMYHELIKFNFNKPFYIIIVIITVLYDY